MRFFFFPLFCLHQPGLQFCIRWEEFSMVWNGWYLRLQSGRLGRRAFICTSFHNLETEYLTPSKLIECVQRERQRWRGGRGPSITSDAGFRGSRLSSNFLRQDQLQNSAPASEDFVTVQPGCSARFPFQHGECKWDYGHQAGPAG